VIAITDEKPANSQFHQPLKRTRPINRRTIRIVTTMKNAEQMKRVSANEWKIGRTGNNHRFMKNSALSKLVDLSAVNAEHGD
jgi:hypothetical protein